MKNFELKCIKENFIETFLDNTLGRNSDVKAFAKIINSIENGYSIALDGSWGSGKTFFVNHVKLYLDALNNCVNNIDEENSEKIKSECIRLQGRNAVEIQPMLSIYYDAWENDNDEDPVLSLVCSIIEEIDEDFSIPNNNDIVDTAANILEFFSGKNFKNLIESLRRENPLEGIKKSKKIKEEINSFFARILEERGNKLVVFIDELDRCKPSYAVQLLERIKHYFSNDNVVFVFSLNINELQHTVKKFYGENFDAIRYLDKFFDLRVPLPPVNIENYYRSVNYDSRSTFLFDLTCRSVIKKYNLSLREIARYLQYTKIAAGKIIHDNNKDFSFSNGRAMAFCLKYVVPIAIGLALIDYNRYDKFLRGEDPTPLYDFMDSQYPFADLLCRGEEFVVMPNNLNVVTKEQKLKEVYNALFVESYEDNGHVIVGNCEFNKRIKNELSRVISLCSQYTNVED